MVWEQLGLWERITVYGLIVAALFVFAMLSKLKINGRPVLSLKYRILIALLFPLLLVLLFLFGAVVIGVIVLALIVIFIIGLLNNKKIKRIRI